MHAEFAPVSPIANLEICRKGGACLKDRKHFMQDLQSARGEPWVMKNLRQHVRLGILFPPLVKKKKGDYW